MSKRYDMKSEYNTTACEDQVKFTECADGAWVRYEDFAAQQAERDALLEKNKRYIEEICDMIDKCDHYHEWADKLANEISEFFDLDIGEHSSANCPWFEAWNNMPSRAAHDAEVAEKTAKHIIDKCQLIVSKVPAVNFIDAKSFQCEAVKNLQRYRGEFDLP